MSPYTRKRKPNTITIKKPDLRSLRKQKEDKHHGEESNLRPPVFIGDHVCIERNAHVPEHNTRVCYHYTTTAICYKRQVISRI